MLQKRASTRTSLSQAAAKTKSALARVRSGATAVNVVNFLKEEDPTWVKGPDAPLEAKFQPRRHDDAPVEDLSPYEAYELAERFNLPSGQVTKAWKLFKRYDKDGVGAISSIEFQLLIRCVLRGRYPSAREVPRELFWQVKDGEDLDFIDFLIWVTKNCFSELLLLSNMQRTIRQIARTYKKPIPEVEAIKAQFDKFDEDGSGKIEYNEFGQLLSVLLGIKDESSLPTSRVRAFWRELDSDGSGYVDFQEFIPWYVGYFDVSNPYGACPLEDFYRNIRPVPFSYSIFD
jgi:Ca2+-binding EF-hand superfamily protein